VRAEKPGGCPALFVVGVKGFERSYSTNSPRGGGMSAARRKYTQAFNETAKTRVAPDLIKVI
jgi:hypothetical protein